MTIDYSKIQPGDKITVELLVTTPPGLHKGIDDYVVYADRQGLPSNSVAIVCSSILFHTPKPWVPKVGDNVRVLSRYGGLEGTGHIMYLVDDGSYYMIEFAGQLGVWQKRVRSYIELIT